MARTGVMLAALGLSACVSNVATVTHDRFDYSGRKVEIIKETFMAQGSAARQTRYFVESNFQRYPCDGTVPDCYKVYERAETFPRERGRDEAPIWIIRR